MRKADEFKLAPIEDDAMISSALSKLGKATAVEDVFTDIKIEEPRRSSRRSRRPPKKTSKRGGDDPESFFTSMMFDIVEEVKEELKTDEVV